MLIKVLSVVGPVLYWMGLVQGDRKIDGLDRWDGTAASLIIPPHLLPNHKVAKPHQDTPENCASCVFGVSDDGSPVQLGFRLPEQEYSNFEYRPLSTLAIPSTPSYSIIRHIIAVLASYTNIVPPTVYLALTGTAVAVSFQTLKKYSSLVSASQGLKTRIQVCIQPPLKKLIEKYHNTNAANSCYAELTDVLSRHNNFLKAWVDSLIAAKEFANNGIASSGHLPEDCHENQDDKHQMPPATEPEKPHFDALEGQNEFLRWTIQVKDREIEHQRVQKETLQANSADNDQTIIDLRAENAKVKQSLKDRDEEKDSLRVEKTALQSELAGKVHRIEKIALNSRAKEQKIGTLEEQNLQLQREQEDKDRHIGTLERETLQLQQGQNDKDQRISTLEEENLHLQQLRKDKNQRIGTLKEENLQLKQNQKDKDQRIGTLERELKNSSAEKDATIKALEAGQARLREDLERKEAEIANLRIQLEASRPELNGPKTETPAVKDGQKEDRASNGKAGSYALKETHIHEATFVATDTAVDTSLPHRPPTPKPNEKRVPAALPQKPQYTGLPAPKTKKSSPAPSVSTAISSPGSDLLRSLASETVRPKGVAPPLLPHHQSFAAGQSSSDSSSDPFTRFENLPRFGTSSANAPSGSSPIVWNFPGLGASSATTASIFSPLDPSAAHKASSSNDSVFSNKVPTSSGPFVGFESFNPSAPNMPSSSNSTVFNSNFTAASGPFTGFRSSNPSAATQPSSSSGSVFKDKLPTAPGSFAGFRPMKPSAATAPPTNQRPVFPSTGPAAAPSALGISHQNTVMALENAVGEAMGPFARNTLPEARLPADPNEPFFKPIPMPKRRVRLSKPWPIARQTDGDSCWRSEASVSWPHCRQINGKPYWL